MTSRQTEPDLSISALMEQEQYDTEGVQLVDVWVEDPVHEADAGTFVGILIWEFHVNFPEAAGERC